MRYRLRTLLIVVTLACLYFSWLSFAVQRARFHRRQAADLVSRIAAAEQYTPNEIDSSVMAFAAGTASFATKYNYIRGGANKITYIDSTNAGRVVNDETADKWLLAIHHTRKARIFDRAALQPWILFNEWAIGPQILAGLWYVFVDMPSAVLVGLLAVALFGLVMFRRSRTIETVK